MLTRFTQLSSCGNSISFFRLKRQKYFCSNKVLTSIFIWNIFRASQDWLSSHEAGFLHTRLNQPSYFSPTPIRKRFTRFFHNCCRSNRAPKSFLIRKGEVREHHNPSTPTPCKNGSWRRFTQPWDKFGPNEGPTVVPQHQARNENWNNKGCGMAHRQRRGRRR